MEEIDEIIERILELQKEIDKNCKEKLDFLQNCIDEKRECDTCNEKCDLNIEELKEVYSLYKRLYSNKEYRSLAECLEKIYIEKLYN